MRINIAGLSSAYLHEKEVLELTHPLPKRSWFVYYSSARFISPSTQSIAQGNDDLRMRVEGGEGRKKRGGRTRRKGRKRLGRTGDMSVCRPCEVTLSSTSTARKQVRNPTISLNPNSKPYLHFHSVHSAAQPTS